MWKEYQGNPTLIPEGEQRLRRHAARAMRGNHRGSLSYSLVDLRAEVRLRVDERVDVAEALIAVLQKLCRGLFQERPHVPVQSLVERACCRVMVRARAALWLRDDLLDHAHRDDLSRSELQLLGSLHLARVVAPHN